MNINRIIIKKRNGHQLNQAEIYHIINQLDKGILPAYQMSALLMAIYFQGMHNQEITNFTKAMIASGLELNLSHLKKPCIDKHSTGGVGDKISIILAPLAASCGLIVPMICGRGLGHTGGTLDKLESIPGFNTQLSLRQFKKQLAKIGVAIIGQTKEIVPADKKIYALRDVTGTVESTPLISASIMSKKIAEGIAGLVLDVKVGSGAFMKTLSRAENLARKMIAIGHGMEKRVIAVLSNMNQPLGYAIGNTLEIIESIEVLRNKGPEDVRELTLILTGYMLYLAKKAKTPSQGRKAAEKNLRNGMAYKKFIELIKHQGGKIRCLNNPDKFKKAKRKILIRANSSGYVRKIDTARLGVCSVQLGAGRMVVTTPINHSAGIIIYKKIGDPVSKGEPLACLFTNKELLDDIPQRIRKAYILGKTKPKKPPLIYKVIMDKRSKY